MLAQVRIAFGTQPIIGRERVLFAGENVDLMALGKPLAKGLRVHLRASVVAHRVSVDDVQYLHSAPPRDRIVSILQPYLSPLSRLTTQSPSSVAPALCAMLNNAFRGGRSP